MLFRSPSVRGTTPRRRVLTLQTCHRMLRHVCGPVAMLWWHCNPPRPPAGLTLDQLTHGSTPLTFAGRGLTNRLLHLAVIGQPIGTLRIKVRAQPTARFAPCLPDVAVSPLHATAAATSVRGVTLRSRVPGACTCHHTSRRVRGPSARPGGIATPPPSTPSRLTQALLTGRI